MKSCFSFWILLSKRYVIVGFSLFHKHSCFLIVLPWILCLQSDSFTCIQLFFRSFSFFALLNDILSNLFKFFHYFFIFFSTTLTFFSNVCNFAIFLCCFSGLRFLYLSLVDIAIIVFIEGNLGKLNLYLIHIFNKLLCGDDNLQVWPIP